jgi:AcrR family transcriptional regulator
VSVREINQTEKGASDARERLLAAAYDLFSRQGVRAVGVDTIIARAGVAKMTFYHHFPSKDDLVLAFLQRRERVWTHGWLEAEVKRRATIPGERLLSIFYVFDEWFKRDDFERCSFINILLEMVEPNHRIRKASTVHLANIRSFLRELAAAAGVADVDDFARKWHVLMKGCIVAAGEGDRLAARRARQVGEVLLAAVLDRSHAAPAAR